MSTNASGHTPAESGFPAALLTGDHWIEKLDDGHPVLVRPIRPEDRERERRFIERLSPEARRFRFMGEMRTPSPALLDQLVDIDYEDRMAFIALAHDDGELREVGVSRYAASDEKGRCECAVTVADDWQHRGLAVRLMRHLIGVARQHGFKQMFSMDSGDNQPMRELARFLGFHCRTDPGDATQVIYTLDL